MLPGASPSTSAEIRTDQSANNGSATRHPRLRRWIFVLLLAGPLLFALSWWRKVYWNNWYQSSCKQAVEHQQWDRLYDLSRAWTQFDPSQGDAWVFLSEAAHQRGEYQLAAEALGHLRDDYHGVLQGLALRAELQFNELQRPYDAVATWQRMLAINPHADLARQRLIYFYSMTLQRDKLLEHILRGMELGCEPPEAYPFYILVYDLNFSDGINVMRKWLESYPHDETFEVALAIYIAKYTADKTQALFGTSTITPGDQRPIRECFQKFPHNLEVRAYLLDVAIYDGNEEEVLQLIDELPPAADRDPRFWRARGWYLLQQDLHTEAEQALRAALERHPADWKSWLLLSNVLRRLQKPEADRAAAIAAQGKELQRALFELPNAKSWDRELGQAMYKYLREVAPPVVWQALARRL
ncbi:MAG: hypothetical protein KatS3mg114_0294 [Planctomycetaceae bacterium]|nr:MAG: hypothetical protein KatS3mg114_0294 [Planctomycetaceae bacterium]